MVTVFCIVVFSLGIFLPSGGTAAIYEEISGEIASEVSTKASGADGTRHSKTSDWTEFTVPDNHVINKEKTEVQVISARGSEHRYEIEYDNYVELIPGTDLKWPRTIKVRTHARSSKGSFGGGGGMKIKVQYKYTKFK